MDRGSIIIFWEWSSPHFPFYPAFFDQDMINLAYSLVCSFLEMVFPVMSVLSITRGRLCRGLQLHPGLAHPNLHITPSKYTATSCPVWEISLEHVLSMCLLLLFPGLVTPLGTVN